MGRLVIAAPQSGAGKTTLCLGLLAALSRRGVRVQPFKVGPDFIDPGLHQLAAGAVSHNLDGWMLSRAENLALFNAHTYGKDVALVEGVMGLFDGRGETAEKIPPGSTAELAVWLEAPVVLVVNAQGQGQSIAALIKGFEEFHPQLHIAGVIFNRVGSARHTRLLTHAVETHCRARVLGSIPRDTEIAIPERHLGTPDRRRFSGFSSFWDRLARLITEHVDLTALLGVANAAGELPQTSRSTAMAPSRPHIRLGVARDAAFCFYYHDNFHRLAVAGADLIFFSPLVEAHLPEHLDALWIGGGYPELHAEALAANVSMREDIRRFAETGHPIHAECGGLMYLCETLYDAALPLLRLTTRNRQPISEFEGAQSPEGRIWGTSIHGVFDSASLRRQFLDRVRASKGLSTLLVTNTPDALTHRLQEYDRFADVMETHVDMARIRALIETSEAEKR